MPDQAELIRLAGLEEDAVKVTGFAPACVGEPDLLVGIIPATRAFVKIVGCEFHGIAGAVAHISAAMPPIEPTEMERERLNVCASSDKILPTQQEVIQMVRDRDARQDPAFTIDGPGEVIEGEATEVTEPVRLPPATETPLNELSPKDLDALIEGEQEGWG